MSAPDGGRARGPDVPSDSGVTCVVLAAGASTRMEGSNKLLRPVGGVPMVVRVVRAAVASKAHRVVVVTGRDAELVRAALAGLSVSLVRNHEYGRGLSSSLQVGLAALRTSARAVVVCLGDMPLVRAEHIDELIQAFHVDPAASIFVPTYEGRRGNPVLWDATMVPEMQALTGDTGAKGLMGQHADLVREVPLDDPGILVDVDTAEALDRLANRDLD